MLSTFMTMMQSFDLQAMMAMLQTIDVAALMQTFTGAGGLLGVFQVHPRHARHTASMPSSSGPPPPAVSVRPFFVAPWTRS